MIKDQKKAVFFALVAVACWSTVATAFKLTLAYFSVWQLLLVAGSCSTLLLLGVLYQQNKLGLLVKAFKANPFFFMVSGALNPLLYYWVLLSAYDLLPGQQAQTLNYTWAITLSLLAVPFLGQRLAQQDFLAILLGYSGAVVIATRGDLLGLNFVDTWGVLLALASTLIWSAYWIINTRNAADPLVALTLNFLLALPLILLGTWIWSDFYLLAWQGWLGGIYLGVFEMGLAFVFWLLAMQSAESTARIANLIFISPFVSLLLLYFLVGEPIYTATLVGLVMIILALFIQQKKRQPSLDQKAGPKA